MTRRDGSRPAKDAMGRERIEEKLCEATRRLEELAHAFDLAPTMVRTIDGRIVRWGRGLQSLLGWTAEEAVGSAAEELLATEPRAQLSEATAQLLDRGEWQGELTRKHRDGHQVIMATRWALHRASDGTPLSVLEVGQDITDHRWAVAMLEEREARLRSVLETAPDAIITIDEKGVIQSFSQAAERIFGYAAGEVVGCNVNVLMHVNHARRHDTYLSRYLRTGEARIIGIGRQVEARDKSGRVFPIELAVGEVHLGGHRIFTGFIRDITTRTRMEQDLRQAQKMEAIGQLTGGIAHDFNNLLTVIQGNLELLEARLKTASQQELIRDALEATELGAQLSRRLLAFGRRQSLDPKPVDVNALVVGMTDLLRRTLGKPIQVETRLTEGLPITLADPGQVENALLNLAINARDAMANGGMLLVETGKAEIRAEDDAPVREIAPGSYVTLSVTDNGAGMSAEVMQRAFEPYFSTKAGGSGSGLGLSMVYGFVKQTGGHVELESVLGRGTVVRIFLKAASNPAQRHEPPRPRTAPQDRRRRRRVLIVEDDPRVRRTAVRRLRQLGYDVQEADSGAAGLEILRNLVPGQRIDVLFTDIIMPGGLSGFDLAREATRLRPGLCVLLTSGYADPAAIERALAEPHTDWIGKPYALDELGMRLGRLLA